MNGYTKTGLLVLMIFVVLALCSTLAAYSFYSSIHPTDLQGQHSSFLFGLWPLTIIGGVAGLLNILGAIFIYLGRKEFGEKHRKYIFYSIIIFIVICVLIIIFTRSISLTAFSWITSGQPSSTATSMGDYFMTHIISSFIDSLILAIPFGLIWVLGLYNLENKKGRIILLAVYVTMILIPIVTFIGSFSVVNDWITHGTLDNLINATTSSSMRSELFSISQWTGPTGIILLLSQLLNSILVFVALYIPYKRIITGELKPNLPTAPTKA